MGRKRIRQALPAMGSRAAEQGDGARRGAEARCARHRAPRLIPNAFSKKGESSSIGNIVHYA
jgi:hypothetical protein